MDTIQLIYHLSSSLEMYQTVRFDEHVLAYAVSEPTIAQGTELVFIKNISYLFNLLYIYTAVIGNLLSLSNKN